MNKEEVIYDSDICYHQMFLFNCICFCNKKWVIECWINSWLFLLLCLIKCGWIFYHTTKWVYSGAEGQIRLVLHFSLCSSMRCHGAACKFAWWRGRFPSCGSLQKIKDTNQPLSTYLLFPWPACKMTFKTTPPVSQPDTFCQSHIPSFYPLLLLPRVHDWAPISWRIWSRRPWGPMEGPCVVLPSSPWVSPSRMATLTVPLPRSVLLQLQAWVSPYSLVPLFLP